MQFFIQYGGTYQLAIESPCSTPFLNRENSEKLWLQREAVAQEEFRLRKLEEERRIKQKEEQEVNELVFNTNSAVLYRVSKNRIKF